jgi:hypothetical protein
VKQPKDQFLGNYFDTTGGKVCFSDKEAAIPLENGNCCWEGNPVRCGRKSFCRERIVVDENGHHRNGEQQNFWRKCFGGLERGRATCTFGAAGGAAAIRASLLAAGARSLAIRKGGCQKSLPRQDKNQAARQEGLHYLECASHLIARSCRVVGHNSYIMPQLGDKPQRHSISEQLLSIETNRADVRAG